MSGISLSGLFYQEGSNISIVDDATGEEFLPDPKYSRMFPIPMEIEQIDRNYLLNNIESGNELCFIKLISLCGNYFPYPKLMQMAWVGNKEVKETAINSSCFLFVLEQKRHMTKN